MERKKTFLNIFSLLLLASLLLLGCKEQEKQVVEDVVQSDSVTQEEFIPIKQNENKDRDVWQKPNTIIDLLGDLSEKTVADIGAGTGYFTFRLALKAEKVIAIDIEERFLEIINTFKRNLPAELQDRIETRLATPSDPLLKVLRLQTA